MENRIYLSPPHMTGGELKYVYEAFHTNWIAPLGANVDGFEREVCALTGARAAAALSSGSSAIYLSLLALGVQRGDTVLCSTLTFAGSCFPIRMLGAEPVFIDSEPVHCNMSPVALGRALTQMAREGNLPRAAIIVDLYGNPADYGSLLMLCEKYGVPVIEDAAEALGAAYMGRSCGRFGRFGVFSFNGNKIITTSGGGMVLSDDEAAIQKIRFWASQSREPALHYEHKEVGYNFRLSNICAGIGRGQLEGLKEKISAREKIGRRYRQRLGDLPVRFVEPCWGGEPNHWLTVMLVAKGTEEIVGRIIQALDAENIESRPMWKPMHAQPVFADARFFAHEQDDAQGTSLSLFHRGVCLPSGETLTEEEQERVIGIIRRVMEA